MPKIGILWMIWGFLSIANHDPAVALNVDVSLNNRNTGYFLKPLFSSGHQAYNVDERYFALTQPSGSATVRAAYGPYEVEENISPGLLQASLGNSSHMLNDLIVKDMDISAHIVSRSITQEQPQLQVLFHASQLVKESGKNRNSKSSTAQQSFSKSSTSRWCLQAHALKNGVELTSVCVLNSQDGVCIAEITLPSNWWDMKLIQSADVFYSVYPIDQTLECSSSSNSIVPDKTDPKISQPRLKSFISTITLTHGQLSYQEVKEDQHILLYIPQKSFFPGSKFRVPVRLEAESDLQLFVVRVKARHGIKVIGAEPVDPSVWHLTVDINHKKRGAMITAFVQDRASYTKTARVQAIFDWIFEVEGATDDEDAGRLMFNLEYEMNTQMKENYGTVENRVVARVQIQYDDTYTIVPVIKTFDLINQAILTGKIQNYPMRIFSVGQAGKVTDITSQTTCHSGDEDILKVAQSCNLVYLDGSESKGSSSLSVIAKYGRHTKFMFFRVWVPEFPLEIQLSDNKLSQVKGWKVPKHQRRKARGVDFGLLTHPGLVLKEDDQSRGDPEVDLDADGDYSTSCHLRFQQSEVEVYVRFYIPDGQKNQYLVHRKALLKITDLVQDKLRIADLSVASLSQNIVEGLRPGRTEIQVLSRMGRVIGAKEIKVGNDKVTMERLQVDVVTQLTMEVSAETELPGSLVVRVERKAQLEKKYQEGVLDISMVFSDGTSTSLQHIPPTDYFLDMDTLNNHIIAFGPMLSPDQPRVIALGQGKGELLKLALELGDSCQRKKSRPLAVSYVYVDVDFIRKGEDKQMLQSDASGLFNQENRASDRYDHSDVKKDKLGNQQGDSVADKDVKVKSGHDGGEKHKSRSGIEGIPLDIDLADLAPGEVEAMADYVPNHEAQQQHVTQAMGMSPLEIGMYVLLAVFCLAIIVFVVNCMVFVVKYRRKQMPREVKDTIQQAHDWVWIGRDTLERNAINTTCSQTLMPEADFNGNQQSPHLLQANPTGTNPRNSACSSGSGSGSGGPGSNRNSVVSTYKGSECSIRITANPLSTDNNGNETEPGNPETSVASSDPLEAALAQELPLLPPNLNLRPPPHMDPYNTTSSHETVEWDYEAMGMSYDQLMEYFDNLKESTA